MALSACSSTMSTKVTNETLGDVATSVAHSSISDTEKALFARAVIRANAGEYDVTDKTVQTIISDQRQLEADAAAKQAEQDRLADEARAKRAAIEAQLNGALTVALVSKGFKDSDPDNGDFESKITIELILKNTGSKPIRSFSGVLHFQNTLGSDIHETKFTSEDRLNPGVDETWDGSLNYNQFEDADVALKNAEMSNLHLVFEPRTILFVDGTRLDAPDAESSNS
jgi:hypothetical protein